MQKNGRKKFFALGPGQDSNPGRWIQSPQLYQLSYRRIEEIWAESLDI